MVQDKTLTDLRRFFTNLCAVTRFPLWWLMKVLFLLPHQTLTFPARPLSVTEVRWASGCVVHAHLLVPVLSGEVLIEVEVCRCPCTFYGMCSSLVLHRFPILRDVGSCRCRYVGCSSYCLFALHWFAMGAVPFLNGLHVVQNPNTKRCSSPPGHMRI